jgi:hypothetical protein
MCICSFPPVIGSLLKCNHCFKLFYSLSMMFMRDCDGDIFVICQFSGNFTTGDNDRGFFENYSILGRILKLYLQN